MTALSWLFNQKPSTCTFFFPLQISSLQHCHAGHILSESYEQVLWWIQTFLEAQNWHSCHLISARTAAPVEHTSHHIPQLLETWETHFDRNSRSVGFSA